MTRRLIIALIVLFSLPAYSAVIYQASGAIANYGGAAITINIAGTDYTLDYSNFAGFNLFHTNFANSVVITNSTFGNWSDEFRFFNCNDQIDASFSQNVDAFSWQYTVGAEPPGIHIIGFITIAGHYGWMRLDCTPGVSLEIVDYAYEDVPGTAISACDQNGGAAPGISADFNSAMTTICVGTCIDFTDLTTGQANNPTWNWSFTGATPSNSQAQNPTNICYNTAGVYQVELTANDGNGNPDTETKVGYINVVEPPNAGTDQNDNLCNNANVDLNDLIIGADAGGAWTETSAVPSGQFNTATGVLNGNGLAVGSVYTFSYTASGSGNCVDATSSHTITIIDCTAGAPPNAEFDVPQTQICVGECLDFDDLSFLGPNPSWEWTFDGANTATSTQQNPTGICYDTPGSYLVQLTVTNDNGADTETKMDYIVVVAAPIPEDIDDQTLCNNGFLNLNTLLDNATQGAWQETSPMPSGQFDAINGVFDGNDLTPDNMYTFSYTIQGTGTCQDAISTTSITIKDCGDDNSNTSIPLEDSVKLYAPNAFTPDGNGFNDTWKLFLDGTDIYGFHLVIYNRWGEIMWETYDQTAEWDGSLGTTGYINPGVYSWILHTNGVVTDKKYSYSGSVIVLR